MTDGWQDAALSAWFAFERLESATTLGQQAAAFTDLSNAMADLGTWLPGYDVDTGTITDDTVATGGEG